MIFIECYAQTTSMWLRTPESIEKVIWEAPMEPLSDDAIDLLVRDIKKRERIIINSDELKNGLPIISIGLPEVWDLVDLYPPGGLPQSMKVRLNESDFYIVRFSCSFRPKPNGCNIDWARFIVQLYPGDEGQPIAFDLYPSMVTQEVKHNVKVTLSPTIRFQEVEAGLGCINFGIEYVELNPIISANGVGEDQISWDYHEAKGSKIQGSRLMHMLLKVPKGMKPVVALLDLIADVKIREQFLRLIPGKKEITAKTLRLKLIE
mgnify:FL=1|jgi:hypothetical protein